MFRLPAIVAAGQRPHALHYKKSNPKFSLLLSRTSDSAGARLWLISTFRCPCSQRVRDLPLPIQTTPSWHPFCTTFHINTRTMRKWTEFISRQPKSFIVALGFLLVTLFGIADYVTGEELFFLELYLIPVMLVAWYVSEKAGILISLASGVFWFIDDVVERNPSGQPSIPFWNVGLKLVIFILFVRLISSFKRAMEKERLEEQEHVRRELEIARQCSNAYFHRFCRHSKRSITRACASLCSK